MTFCLKTIIIKPEKDIPINNAIILLHGYGGDGKDINMLTLNWTSELTALCIPITYLIQDLIVSKRTAQTILIKIPT